MNSEGNNKEKTQSQREMENDGTLIINCRTEMFALFLKQLNESLYNFGMVQHATNCKVTSVEM